MKSFKVGGHLWISRFNPSEFDGYVDDDGNLVKPSKRCDIFTAPSRYTIMSAYQTDEKHNKWYLELSAGADVSELSTYDVMKSEIVRIWGFVGAASLSDPLKVERFPKFMRVELSYDIVSRGVFKSHENLYISRKKGKLLQSLWCDLRRWRNRFKRERKYTDMSLINSCIMCIKSEDQMIRMMDRNPEDYL